MLVVDGRSGERGESRESQRADGSNAEAWLVWVRKADMDPLTGDTRLCRTGVQYLSWHTNISTKDNRSNCRSCVASCQTCPSHKQIGIMILSYTISR
jgi:hypothetical protein